jgi:tripartite-type tricarboxylate transporter receptor subunit TctC
MLASLNRRQFGAAAVALAARPSWGQGAWPQRPVRIVVPFGAGGIADLTARTVGQALAQRLGQSVVIDNRPGAGGVIAGELVAKSAPDGYTLLLVSNGTAVSAGLFRKLPFDTLADFAPISLIGLFDLAVIVPAHSPLRSLQDLLAAARAQPGKLNIATVNVGSTQNLAAELFKSTAGIQAQVVPFNGTPAVITALRGGQVDAAVEILGPVKAQVTSGALRALAVMGEKRAAALPPVPTLAETGGALAHFDVASWNGLAAPAGTPHDVVQRLASEMGAVLSNPQVRTKLAQLDVEARAGTPAQLSALLASEVRRWREVIQRAGIPQQ